MSKKPLTPPTLPWLCSQDKLPCPLPTIAEIEAATKSFPSIHDPSARRTVLVKKHFVVKYGPYVYENEGHALLFLEAHAKVPTPRLYAMYRRGENLYIISEFISGHGLGDIWPSLTEDEKAPIMRQLRHSFDYLRAIPSPGTFGGVFGGAYCHSFFFSFKKDPRITGPFTKDTDVARALALRGKDIWDMQRQRGWITEFFARQLPTVLRSSTSVFSHADFQRKNIIIREKAKVKGNDKDKKKNPGRCFEVAAIVDWESAGWYPAYWDFSSCLAHFGWDDDWEEKVERILDPYIAEGTLMRMVGEQLG